MPFSQNNITNEAEYRALQVANTMREGGVFVYSLGMETPGTQFVNVPFLESMANVPGSQGYNPNLPVGQAVIAPDASQLQQAFQQLANTIIYRLTQ
jgi:hypothetical protein